MKYKRSLWSNYRILYKSGGILNIFNKVSCMYSLAKKACKCKVTGMLFGHEVASSCDAVPSTLGFIWLLCCGLYASHCSELYTTPIFAL